MRGITLIALAVTAACGPKIRYRGVEQSFVAIDLRPYTAEGFLFTPDPLYAGRYESLGIVSLTIAAAGTFVRPNSAQYADYWKWEPIDLQSALKEAQRRVVSMGGNALVNFRVQSRTDGTDGRPGYEVSGFAIKRLDIQAR